MHMYKYIKNLVELIKKLESFFINFYNSLFYINKTESFNLTFTKFFMKLLIKKLREIKELLDLNVEPHYTQLKNKILNSTSWSDPFLEKLPLPNMSHVGNCINHGNFIPPVLTNSTKSTNIVGNFINNRDFIGNNTTNIIGNNTTNIISKTLKTKIEKFTHDITTNTTQKIVETLITDFLQKINLSEINNINIQNLTQNILQSIYKNTTEYFSNKKQPILTLTTNMTLTELLLFYGKKLVKSELINYKKKTVDPKKTVFILTKIKNSLHYLFSINPKGIPFIYKILKKRKMFERFRKSLNMFKPPFK